MKEALEILSLLRSVKKITKDKDWINFMKNISLIGMPGSGKSTVGVLLAKVLGYDFVDTDLIVQKREGKLLQELVDDLGVEAFLDVEEAAILSLDVERSVLSPGGSVVCRPAMVEKLKSLGPLVYLEVPLVELEERITDLSTRGIAMEVGETLSDVMRKRAPLYEQYADIRVPVKSGQTPKELVDVLVRTLQSGDFDKG